MQHSPPRSESRAKAEESTEPGTLARFKSLAGRLFGLDRRTFLEAAQSDERERAKRRALGAIAPKPSGKSDHKP